MSVQVLNSFRTGPDERGQFGIFGGRYVAETLMPAIAEGFEFPDYFGGNWDALEECLRDLAWLKAKGYAIVIEKGETFWKTDADMAGKLVRSWTTAAEKWVAEGVPFNLVFVR